MSAVVVDASIIVKWFVEEEGSDEAIKIRDEYINGKIKLIAPELINFEVLNALHYKRLFSEDELGRISEALDAFSIELCSLRGEYAAKTIEVAYKNNITIYDAAYISLAIMKNTYVYTADRKLKNKLEENYSLYVKVI